jgi:hypothetical protein
MTHHSYGFEYQHADKRFAFDMSAKNQEEAEVLLRNMALATCIWELRLDKTTAELQDLFRYPP